MRTARWMLMLALGLGPVSACWAAQGDGLTLSADELPWSRWQTRMSMAGGPLWRADLPAADRPGFEPARLSLMGDYYFSRSIGVGGSASGFRTTSGLLIGPRSGLSLASLARGGQQPGLPFSTDRRLFGTAAGSEGSDTATLPYLGIGYTGLSVRGGWSVSADLGLVALAPGQAVKLGRVFNGTQALDDLVRDMRLSPVLQLGVSYSF